MTPVEEQILRNQMATLALLSALAEPNNDELTISGLQKGFKCVEETSALLETESDQGRTVHPYPAP